MVKTLVTLLKVQYYPKYMLPMFSNCVMCLETLLYYFGSALLKVYVFQVSQPALFVQQSSSDF